MIPLLALVFVLATLVIEALPAIRDAARMFANEYIVEQVRRGISCTGSIPEVFAERLLAHL